MPKINRTRYAILGMLSYGPKSGYDLKKAFDQSISFFWQEDFGHIYPELKRLEEEGFVTKTVEPAEGKPARHVYSITAEGRRNLEAWLLLPAARPNYRVEILLKVFFGALIPKENLREKLEEEKRFSLETLATFEKIEEQIRKAEASPASGTEEGTGAEACPVAGGGNLQAAKFGRLSLAYGRECFEGVVRWCDKALSEIEE